VRRPLPALLLLLLLLLLVPPGSPLAATPPPPTTEPLLLGPSYPVEVAISFPAALLHWLDSLAGVEGHGATAGKTVEAHREEFVRLFGRPDPSASERLLGFARARRAVAGRLPRERRDALTVAFFEARTLDDALRAAAAVATEDELAALGGAIETFEPRYRRIWSDGAEARQFLARVSADERAAELAALLVRIARFYDVSPTDAPHPRIVLVPVPPGHGTHAQAIGRHLLIEIRPGEGLVDQVAPIVHENAHFLFQRVDPERLASLERLAAEHGPIGDESWLLLREALPTALGQGVASRRFQPDFSLDARWYHLDEVDAYAKRIYPLVSRTVRRGGRFDAEFVRETVELRATRR
jgi:hypothetical protein